MFLDHNTANFFSKCYHGSPPFIVCSEYYDYAPILRIYITCCSHLGEEVALYCSKYLPDIIKEQKTYKDGKLQKVRSHRSRDMTSLVTVKRAKVFTTRAA